MNSELILIDWFTKNKEDLLSRNLIDFENDTTINLFRKEASIEEIKMYDDYKKFENLNEEQIDDIFILGKELIDKYGIDFDIKAKMIFYNNPTNERQYVEILKLEQECFTLLSKNKILENENDYKNGQLYSNRYGREYIHILELLIEISLELKKYSTTKDLFKKLIKYHNEDDPLAAIFYFIACVKSNSLNEFIELLKDSPLDRTVIYSLLYIAKIYLNLNVEENFFNLGKFNIFLPLILVKKFKCDKEYYDEVLYEKDSEGHTFSEAVTLLDILKDFLDDEFFNQILANTKDLGYFKLLLDFLTEYGLELLFLPMIKDIAEESLTYEEAFMHLKDTFINYTDNSNVLNIKEKDTEISNEEKELLINNTFTFFFLSEIITKDNDNNIKLTVDGMNLIHTFINLSPNSDDFLSLEDENENSSNNNSKFTA